METNNSQGTVSPDNKQENKSSIFTEAAWLAIASAVAYLSAFIYERGYVSYFGIPQEFINISLIHLLIFGAGILSLLWGVFAFFDVVFPFIRPKHPYLAPLVPWIAVLFLLIVLIPLFIFGWLGKWFFLFTLTGWFLFVFVFLILPLITYRKSGSWTERYNKKLESFSNRNQANTIQGGAWQTFIDKRFGYRHAGFLILLAFQGLILINLAGLTKAEKQEKFLITNTTPAMVVLRVYGDNMICAPFDRSNKEIKKGFVILKIAEDKQLVLNLENVGPLRPVEKLTSESLTPTPTPTPEIVPSITSSPTPPAPNPTASPLNGKPVAN
jgi:hypothetical protein